MKSYQKNSTSELSVTKSCVTFLRTYKVIYLGYAVLDRRYTLPMLPWLIAEVRRHGAGNQEQIFLEVTDKSLKAVNCQNNDIVFEHKLQSISKFAQSSNDPTCFTYMTREVVNGPCAYHVFQANDESTVLELFTTIREATKEISIHQVQAPSIQRTALDVAMSNCQQYEVLYLGRIKVSGKRAPPTFIDDAVEKFRIYEAEKVRNNQNRVFNSRRRHGSGASISSLPPNLNIVENINENGPNKSTNCSNDSFSPPNIAKTKNVDDFNHVYCDNHPETFVQSPMSPMYHTDELHKFNSLYQSFSQDQLNSLPSHFKQKENKNFSSVNNLIPPSSLITHTQSLDAPGCADIVRDLRDSDPGVVLRDRVRSCSGDVPRAKQTSLPSFRQRLGSGDMNDLIRPRAYTSPNPSSGNQQNRTMLFIIGRSEICLIGMDKKRMLLRKTFNDIAHCSQGMQHLDHFGFISRETTLTGADCYAGFIFRCQTERVVDEIMSTLKQAFKQAHDSYQNHVVRNLHVPKIIVCDGCPMNWFHLLCSEIEGMNPEETHLVILKKMGNLADCDKEEIMIKFQKMHFNDVHEQNEILMILLREYCEQKQIKHNHIPHSAISDKSEVAFIKEKYSKLDYLRKKARKSLSSSFESFLKLTNRDEGRDNSSTSVNQALSPRNYDVSISDIEEDSEKDLDTHSYREGSYSEERSSSDRLSPLPSRPRSSTFSSPREKLVIKSNHYQETPKKRPIMNMFMKSGYRNTSPAPYLESSPKGSWRQAIFHRVQTPPSKKNDAGRFDDSYSSEEESPKVRKTKEELRALWKKAIIEQILLIRMEKENKKLQVNQDAASFKRMKLNYEDINLCLKTSLTQWEILLTSGETKLFDKNLVTDLVKLGVPRHKRGDIWQYLAKNNDRSGNNSHNDQDLSTPYDEFLKQLTSHQHSILIDIGRTFPNHPFFSQSLGPGQLALFNLLKAYSLLDKEVGYCQGLSFVAGILLLHMPEEGAFSIMKFLMFNLGLRRQYKTDMVAFQIQMYQLSRLIHDNYRELYEHLEKFDIAPTLYAAPWFLTLFASQFPIGFVARLFDLIFLNGIEVIFKVSLLLLGNYQHELLACDNFESIMEYLKNVFPSIDVLQMEIIFNQVFNLDISRQLNAYEVEYHVLLEEMVHTPSKDHIELERLQVTNKNLKAQNMELMEQLQVAYSRIHSLEASEASLKSSVRRLEARLAVLGDEKEALEHSCSILRKKLKGIVPDYKDEEEDYALANSEREDEKRFNKLILEAYELDAAMKESDRKEAEEIEKAIRENEEEIDVFEK